MEWISIKDKTPPKFYKVLVWIQPPGKSGMFDMGAYNGVHEVWYVVENKHVAGYVTHWAEIEKPKV